MIVDLGQSRWLLYEQIGGSISVPFLLVLVLWFTVIFKSFGLFAPRNPTPHNPMVIATCSSTEADRRWLDIDSATA